MKSVNLLIVEDLEEEQQTEKGEKPGEQDKTLRERGEGEGQDSPEDGQQDQDKDHAGQYMWLELTFRIQFFCRLRLLLYFVTFNNFSALF